MNNQTNKQTINTTTTKQKQQKNKTKTTHIIYTTFVKPQSIKICRDQGGLGVRVIKKRGRLE